jgi:hypothetical protein
VDSVERLTPSQKGAVAEAAIASAALELGLTVLRPLCEGRRYDLAIDLEPQFLRVQCKLARTLNGALAIGLQTNRCTPRGYVSSSYSAAEVDAIGAYSPERRESFLVPIGEITGCRALHLRLDAPRNNQSQGIKWASRYAIEPMLRRLRRDPAALLAAAL